MVSNMLLVGDMLRRYVEELEKTPDLDVLFYGDSTTEEWRWVLLIVTLCLRLDPLHPVNSGWCKVAASWRQCMPTVQHLTWHLLRRAGGPSWGPPGAPLRM